MNNITIENKGIITLGDKVMVSDPCYALFLLLDTEMVDIIVGQQKMKMERLLPSELSL